MRSTSSLSINRRWWRQTLLIELIDQGTTFKDDDDEDKFGDTESRRLPFSSRSAIGSLESVFWLDGWSAGFLLDDEDPPLVMAAAAAAFWSASRFWRLRCRIHSSWQSWFRGKLSTDYNRNISALACSWGREHTKWWQNNNEITFKLFKKILA